MEKERLDRYLKLEKYKITLSLGDFVLTTQPIGQGGNGVVYEAKINAQILNVFKKAVLLHVLSSPQGIRPLMRALKSGRIPCGDGVQKQGVKVHPKMDSFSPSLKPRFLCRLRRLAAKPPK
jgi:hypothetical protein